MPDQEKKPKGAKLPCYPELEIDLLTAALFDPDSGPSIICGSLKKDDFTDPKAIAIFEAMSAIHGRNEPYDAQSLILELGSKGLSQLVETSFVADMINTFCPNPAWVFEHHVKMVRQATVARRLIQVARAVWTDPSRISSTSDGWEGFAERIREKVNEICDGNSTESLLPASEVAKSTLEVIKATKESSKKGLVGVETGIDGLDKLTHGWQPDQLIVIAGRPSMGKSALAAHCAYRAAKAGHEIAFYCLEMNNESNMMRIFSNETNIVTDKISSGYASQDELKRLEEAAEAIGSTHMWFTDRLIGFGEICASITRLKARRPNLKVAFIDYLQLMDPGQSGVSRDREIGIMTGGLKRLAKKLQISIVILSQVKRGAGVERPSLADLRESGNIEQDASIVLFIHRPDYFEGTGQSTISRAEVIVAKNRMGQTGIVKVSYNKSTSSFADISDKGE